MIDELKAIYYLKLGNIWEYPHPEYAYSILNDHLSDLGYFSETLKIKYAAIDAPRLIIKKLTNEYSN